MKSPVPIAPPSPIMTICVLLSPRLSPLSRSLISAAVLMRPPARRRGFTLLTIAVQRDERGAS